MIRPTNEQLLAGIAEALKDTVLPELARSTAARKQLQAAIEILRRIAFALPGEAVALAADNDDMAEVLRQAAAILGSVPDQSIEGAAFERNHVLQARLVELQKSLEILSPDRSAQITPLLTRLYKRMTDRALALIPPPTPRTPRKSS
ncbi:MAG: hypothetical protein JWM91_5056 [Rhodospirillales bacterium]|nr:hypothetical protein [Rhodospirillales bacterium]